MSIENNSDDKLSLELNEQIRAFNLRAIRNFLLMVGLVFTEVYFLGVVFKLGFIVHLFAIPTGGYFLYKLIFGFAQAVKCPKCGQPYGWNPRWMTNIPYASKCQNCGLELKRRSEK